MQRADAYPTDPNAHGDEHADDISIKDIDMDSNPIIHTYRDGIGYTIEHANGDIYEYPYIDSHVIAYINRNTNVHAERDIDADTHSDGGAAEHGRDGRDDLGDGLAVDTPRE